MITLISFIISFVLIGACFALVFVNKTLIRMLKRLVLLNKEAIGLAEAASEVVEESEGELRKMRAYAFKLKNERDDAVRMKDSVSKIAEEFLTRKDEEIRRLIQKVEEKKLKVKHQ